MDDLDILQWYVPKRLSAEEVFHGSHLSTLLRTEADTHSHSNN